MVLETWATDFATIGDHQQMFITQENPVQRRPKLDYFNNDAVQSMIPIVSHISSNGYYGYCAAPTAPPSTDTVQSRIDDDNVQMDIQADIQMVLQPSNQSRRKRCQKFIQNDQAIAMKRCRNQTIDAEIGEDRSIHGYDATFSSSISSQSADSAHPVATAFDGLYNASNTSPTNAAENEAARFSSKTFSGTETAMMSMAPTSKRSLPNGHTDDKDASPICHFNRCGYYKSSCSDDSSDAVDMERLLWHTHGAMLWRSENS